jgi:TrmH family RNA methyltransferase
LPKRERRQSRTQEANIVAEKSALATWHSPNDRTGEAFGVRVGSLARPLSVPLPQRLSNRKAKAIRKLTRRKHRRRQERTLVEGVRAVEAAFEAEAPLASLVADEEARAEDARVAALARRAEAQAVPCYTTTPETLAPLSAVASSQGVLAVAEASVAAPGALAEAAQAVLVLDGVQDPGNAGTALRTAAWFGAGGVLAGPGTAGLYGPKTMRAAMGAHWGLALARTPDLAEALGGLRRAGFALYGADLTGTPARAWQPRTPSALVLGSEAHGLSAPALDLVGEHVALPAASPAGGEGAVESLNVAVAGGILLYEWLAG